MGKTTLGSRVAEQTDMELISVSDLAKQENLYEGYDQERQSYIIDEDRVTNNSILYLLVIGSQPV